MPFLFLYQLKSVHSRLLLRKDQIMTLSAELRIRRDIFIEKYLNKIDNIEMMIEVERATRQIFSRRQMAHPCMVYSRKEMADSVREAIKQIERGEYITDDKLEKEIRTWW